MARAGLRPFYRGMTMQNAVPRDALGRSDYGMCAVNPQRVGPGFNQQALQYAVDTIASQGGSLLEIVNYNVWQWQVCPQGRHNHVRCRAGGASCSGIFVIFF